MALIEARKRVKITKKVISLYILFLPAALLLIIFSYIPMYGTLIAFKNYSPYLGAFKSPWAGLANFRDFLMHPYFWLVLRNTLLINFYDIIFGFTAPIIFAILANELYSKVFKRTIQTISYLPYFLSWVVVAGLFQQMLSPSDGIVNNALVKLFGMEPIYFFAEKSLFRPIAVFADIWKNAGYGAILYFAQIAGIDEYLYEAAYIDGANRIRQVFHITLPGMLPMIILMFLLKLSSIFNIGFERIFLLQNPLVYEVSEVISVYVYRLGLQSGMFSLTTAIGLVQSLLGFVLLLSANKISAKITGLGLY